MDTLPYCKSGELKLECNNVNDPKEVVIILHVWWTSCRGYDCMKIKTLNWQLRLLDGGVSLSTHCQPHHLNLTGEKKATKVTIIDDKLSYSVVKNEDQEMAKS